METKKVTTKTTATKAAAAKRTTARKACARKSSEVAINAQNIGFKAGDVYNALAAADKALSVEEIAKAAGFRTVAVSGSAGAADWAAMQKEADQAILHYGEFFAQMA